MVRDDTLEPVLLGDGDPTSISPNGKWILSIIPSNPSTIILYPTEAGEPRRLDLGKVRMLKALTSWSRDGRKVVFTGAEPGHAPKAYLLDPNSGQTRPITPDETTDPLITPDGEAVLVRDKSMAFVIYPIKGGNVKPTRGISASEVPIQWDFEGRKLYVWDRTLPAKIYRVDAETGKRELWLEIKPADPSGLLFGHIFISPDGQSYAYHFRRNLTDLFVAQNLH